ncbi:Metastasis-associated protein MTA1 [Frankliniella fusca]|uniref:Metastasis-associated protein MTA1 n=1 Tax=Frankliniella fusca TaxID=407009 RepID=A0AAE1I2Y0_9NEOP|nr:Metastasis-associated protein MTA1 [Frankliniella fusca]
MTANMYRVGDYVYFENSSASPYLIRRIEELNKTPNGNVEAKVMCFFRRRDLPNPLVQLADKHQVALEEEVENQKLKKPEIQDNNDPSLNGKQKHQLKHRELFLSRQVETIPATHIRGKCSVTLLNETESLLSYLNKDDTFFYCLVFDPSQKTLLADKGEIRVGGRYQVDPAQMPKELETPENDQRKLEDLETLVWTPGHHLTDRQIDQFLVISRSVGTFARALDCSSSVKQPSLHMSAAAASRDITLFHAMDTLHKHNYDLASAVSSLVPSTGPVLCRDEMEEWSASEANLFEEALDKYGKDFNDIRQDFLPWKTLKNIIEYYYMWKTTDRYVQQKRVKAVEAESKLKQVYIPNYSNKPNPAVINNNKGIVNGNSNGEVAVSGKACESCNVTSSSQWYAWGPTHMQCKLCHTCWQYWKKYGGLKVPSRIGEGESEVKKKSGSGNVSDEDSVSERAPSSLASHRPHRCSIIGCGKEFKLKTQLARHYATVHGLAVRAGSPRPIMKTRTAFYLCTTPLTRISRRLCRALMQTRHAARAPFWAINVPAIKQECQVQMTGKSLAQLKELLVYRKKDRGSVTAIATRLGQYKETVTPEWLILTDKDKMPKAEVVAFPKPPKAADGSLMYERVPNKPEAEKIPLNNMSPHLKRRAIDEVNGMDGHPVPQQGPPPKRSHKDLANLAQQAGLNPNAMVPFAPYIGPCPRPRQIISQLNGKARIAVTRSGSGAKQVLSWMEAPEEVLFRSTEHVKKVRRQLTTPELRRAARKPWRKLSVKGLEDMVVVLD